MSDITGKIYSNVTVSSNITNTSNIGLNILGYASGGVTNFWEMNDTPDSYLGCAGNFLLVNGPETGVSFARTVPISSIENLQAVLDSKANNSSLDLKVDKVLGKQLSTEDYTNAEKSKLATIAEGAEVNVNADWNATSGDAQILNKPSTFTPSAHTQDISTINGLQDVLDSKVDEVVGKQLSTEDYTTVEKSKLAGIATGAEVNVQADWSESNNTSDSYIKNKPALNFEPANSNIQAHISSTSNPHNTTKSQVGLGNVPNVDATNPGNIIQDSNHRFTTDAEKTILSNTSGTNTGDETASTIKSKLGITTLSGSNTGDVTVTDSSEIDFTLTGQSLTASIKSGSIDETKLDDSVNASLDKADTALQSFTETDPIFIASPASNVIDTGDGTMYLSDDGTYKVVEGGVTSVNGQFGDVTLIIPDQLSDLADDSTHRLVTDTEKSTWNAKQPSGDYATNTDLGLKVDKVTGKSLIADSEITRLAGVTNYVLPSDVVQDSSYVHTDNNFTDAEQSKLSGLDPNDYEPANVNIQSHISSISNPHGVIASQVGLGNVDNTSDLNKPISIATQIELNNLKNFSIAMGIAL